LSSLHFYISRYLVPDPTHFSMLSMNVSPAAGSG
jgi:hypothetical protein